MRTLLLAIFFLVAFTVVSRLVAALLRVHDEGEAHSEELLREGVTLEALMDGTVPGGASGGVIPMREGLMLEASPGRLEVTGTRTVARDVF